MKTKLTFVGLILFVLVFSVSAQTATIPNSGFENWTTVGGYENPAGWVNSNFRSPGTFYPVTKSSDHFPQSVGNYSIRLGNHFPLINSASYGYALTENTNSSGCSPSFPITGHPTKLCGYYKCFPLNNDTMQIGLELFKNGIWIAGAEFLCTNTVSDWASFNISISPYTDADSATIAVEAFYNDTTCGFPHGPFGNSVLYVDNLSFDSLITVTPASVNEIPFSNNSFNLSPNPASNIVMLRSDKADNKIESLTIFASNGTIVKSEAVGKNQKEICVSDLSNGLYFVTIKSEGSIETKKLIIQR